MLRKRLYSTLQHITLATCIHCVCVYLKYVYETEVISWVDSKDEHTVHSRPPPTVHVDGKSVEPQTQHKPHPQATHRGPHVLPTVQRSVGEGHTYDE